MSDASSKSKELQMVIFRIGEEEFGVEINQVREIVRLVHITPVPRALHFVEGVVNLRGQILAVLDLAKRLNLRAQPRSDKTRIIVVEIEGSAVGMIVDEVAEVLRIQAGHIDKAPELISGDVQQKYLRGVGKLDDRLIIFIDLASVFSSEEVEDIKKTQSSASDASTAA